MSIVEYYQESFFFIDTYILEQQCLILSQVSRIFCSRLPSQSRVWVRSVGVGFRSSQTLFGYSHKFFIIIDLAFYAGQTHSRSNIFNIFLSIFCRFPIMPPDPTHLPSSLISISALAPSPKTNLKVKPKRERKLHTHKKKQIKT